MTPLGFSRFIALAAWRWLAAVALLGWGAAAQGQASVDVSVNTDVLPGDIGRGQSYTVALGAVAAGTTLNVTWTFTNTTLQAVILLPNRSGSATRIRLTPAARLSLIGENVPGAALVPPVGAYPIDPADLGPVTVPPGGAMTVTFQAQSSVNLGSATASLSLSVGGVYDQAWVEGDSTLDCGTWSGQEIFASDPQVTGSTLNVLRNVEPGCRYTLEDAVFTNDLTYPVVVHYVGYEDSGWMADYISGAVTGWNDITLDPNESSPPFTIMFGMPWYVGNESRGLPPGGFTFTWLPLRTGTILTPANAGPVPALGDGELALLALAVAGIGARRGRNRHNLKQ
jgi:hypothetical protein